MTLSIVARCARTGQLGVAAMTGVPAVGKLLDHAAARTGAIATQARVNPYLGIDGLRLLRQRLSAADVLALLVRADPRIEARQLGIVDASGRTATFTGSECLPYAGVLEGEGFSVQGNRLTGHATLERAALAFQRHEALPLAERLIESLCAADTVGGDRHDEESASVCVVDTEEYPLWDIRVDHHPRPLSELRRLHEIFLAQVLPEILRMPTRLHPGGDDGASSV